MRALVSGAVVLAGVLATAIAQAGETAPHIDTSGVNMQPAYPASAMANKEQGAVLLRVGVTEKGTVSQIGLLQTSGFDDLDATAIAGVMGWHFVPATNDGKPTTGSTQIQIGFQPPETDLQNSKTLEPASDFIPPALTVSANVRESSAYERPIPCTNGSIGTLMRLKRVDTTSELASISVGVRNGVDAAIVSLTGGHFNLKLMHGQTVISEQAYPFGDFIVQGVPILILWDQSGLISARSGQIVHQARLPSSPTTFSFTASSAAVTFLRSDMTCFRGASQNAAN